MNNVFLRVLYLVSLLVSIPLVYAAEEQSMPVQMQSEAEEQGSASVMGSFASDKSEKSELVQIEDQTKRLVMFVMGVPLLILLFATAALGVAMGVYGKHVFLPHMICAGLSLTLALGHAVVGIVWFYPF